MTVDFELRQGNFHLWTAFSKTKATEATMVPTIQKNKDAEEHFQSLDESSIVRSLLNDAALVASGHEPFDDFVVKATFVEGDQSNEPDRNEKKRFKKRLIFGIISTVFSHFALETYLRAHYSILTMIVFVDSNSKIFTERRRIRLVHIRNALPSSSYVLKNICGKDLLLVHCFGERTVLLEQSVEVSGENRLLPQGEAALLMLGRFMAQQLRSREIRLRKICEVYHPSCCFNGRRPNQSNFQRARLERGRRYDPLELDDFLRI